MKRTYCFLLSKLIIISALCVFLVLSGSLLASEHPPILQELLDLPKEQQLEKLYNKEEIVWNSFSFAYVYPNPGMNALIAEQTDNQLKILSPDPIPLEYQDTMYSSHPNDITRLWNECEKRGLLRDFFLAMVNHPSKFCTGEGGAKTEFRPLNISECACINTGALDVEIFFKILFCLEG